MGGFNIIFPQASGGANCECLGSVKFIAFPRFLRWEIQFAMQKIRSHRMQNQKGQFWNSYETCWTAWPTHFWGKDIYQNLSCFVRWFDRQTSTNIPSGAVIAMPLPSTWVFGGSASWRVMFEVPWWNKLQNVLFCWSRLKLQRILRYQDENILHPQKQGRSENLIFQRVELKIAKPSKSYSEDHETAARRAGIQRIKQKRKKQRSFLSIFFFGKSFFFRESFIKFDALDSTPVAAILPSTWKGFLLCDLYYGCCRTGLPNERRQISRKDEANFEHSGERIPASCRFAQ